MFSYQHSAFSFFNQEGHKIPLSPPLEKGELLKADVGFIPQKAGGNQTVEFILYKQGEEEPYESVYLRLDVKEAS